MGTHSLRSRLTSITIATTLALTAVACTPELNPADMGSSDGTSSDVDIVLPEPEPQMTHGVSTTIAPSDPAPERTYISAGTRKGIGNCPIYPRNNVFHADIRELDQHPDSDKIITAMGNENVRGPSSGIWMGSRGGIPINIVDSTTMPLTRFVKQGFLLQPESIGSYPLPPNPRIEGDPTPAWDQHLLLFDTATCRSHEMFLTRTPSLSWYRTWEADAAFTLNLTSNDIPRSASTVSGFSLLAGLVRYEEVASGEIDHVLTVAVPNASNLPPVWPATRTDGKNTDPDAPRIGMWLRLKNVDLDRFGPGAKVIVRALQQHGAIIQDSSTFGVLIPSENDPRWDNNDMKTLKQLTAADFEVVDSAQMMVSPNSYEIR